MIIPVKVISTTTRRTTPAAMAIHFAFLFRFSASNPASSPVVDFYELIFIQRLILKFVLVKI